MTSRTAAAGLLTVGLLQMAGDVLRLPMLKGVGAATAASPAPRVFSLVRGFEAYSTRFFLEWRDAGGKEHSLPLIPEAYARLRGPYNRRNVYGAVIAASPVLASEPTTRALFSSVTTYALCDPAPLLRELGLNPADMVALRIRYEPTPSTAMGALPSTIEAHCP